MKKKNRAIKTSKKKVAPDESFEHGPISFARFGNLTVGQSNWQPGQFEDTQKRLAEAYPRIISEIDSLVAGASGLIAVTDPLSLLRRAWWERAAAYLGIKSEIEVGAEHAQKQRMIDYVQSLIAATPPAESQEAANDETWDKLSNLVTSIFQKLNPWYFISESAHRRATLPAINEAAEEFRFRAQVIWCNVSGAQYQVHNIPVLRELLLPQSDNIRKASCLDGEQLCGELANIWQSLTTGIGDAFNAMGEFRHESLAALKSDIEAGISGDGTLAEQMDRTVTRHGLAQKRDAAVGLFLGLDLFDLQKVTNLPIGLLDDFSWSPGLASSQMAIGRAGSGGASIVGLCIDPTAGRQIPRFG